MRRFEEHQTADGRLLVGRVGIRWTVLLDLAGHLFCMSTGI